VQALPQISSGATGETVRTVQALCVARGHAVTVDGSFGALTTVAVKAVQSAAKISADGVVGAATWPVLLGI
jgi:peptidoglycan hydrolase-like protein with peptidoglycan-binding domain